ncbi:unnamed protein product [Merluccius merluccius]
MAAPLHRLVAEVGGTKKKRGSREPLEHRWTEECEAWLRTCNPIVGQHCHPCFRHVWEIIAPLRQVN